MQQPDLAPKPKRAVSRRAFLTGVSGVAAATLLAACGGSGNKKQKNSTTSAALPPVTPAPANPVPLTPQATPAPLTPAATPTETPDDSPMKRLIIPKAGIDAPFVTLGVIAATNTMDSPKDKDHVGYYDFSPTPTHGGNTVLSGHVDWYTGETGVFWNLKKLQPGDEVDIQLEDGRVVRYRVTDTELYDADSAPVEQIIGPTPVESVTLITCEGVFNRAAAEYNKRRVVRAERIYP